METSVDRARLIREIRINYSQATGEEEEEEEAKSGVCVCVSKHNVDIRAHIALPLASNDTREEAPAGYLTRNGAH